LKHSTYSGSATYSPASKSRSKRYYFVRRIEVAIVRVLHMVSRSWDWKNRRHFKDTPAFCDGWLINGTPWLCFCCTRLRRRLEGRPWKDTSKPWIPGMPMALDFFVIYSDQLRKKWVWPVVKWVYPTRDLVP